MTMTMLAAIALATVPLSVERSQDAFDEKYTITELGSLRAGGRGGVAAINDSGQVVGYTETGKTVRIYDSWAYVYHAFRWDPTVPNGTTGVLNDLGAVNGQFSAALDINNAGHVVGWTGDPTSNYYSPTKYAFVHKGQSMNTLPALTGQSWSDAFGINNQGQIVGRSVSSDHKQRAVRWDSGSTTDLGGFTGQGNGIAYGITGFGRAYGVSDGRAFLTAPNAVINPETDALLSLSGAASALGCNENNEVVGFYRDALFVEHSFVYRNGAMVDLGPPLPGNTQSHANAINDHSIIVGRTFWSEVIYSTRVDHNTAVIWRDGKMIDLNTLIPSDSGWYLLSAIDINNVGQIVCSGTRADFSTGELILTPNGISPPPATDTVSISKADYRLNNKRLSVAASSTNSAVTMKVYVTSTNLLVGPLSIQGGGKFAGNFTLPSNPVNITVKSSGGGSASKDVTVR